MTTLGEFTGASETFTSPRIFSNDTPITFNAGSSSAPGPSRITVPSGIEKIGKVRVILRGFSHPSPSDGRFLLVGPNRKTSLLMSGAGVGGGSRLTLRLDDDAAAEIPFRFGSGVYRPTPDDNSGRDMSSPAPPAPYNTQLSVYNGQPGTGIWS